jgi:hypothetical protein
MKHLLYPIFFLILQPCLCQNFNLIKYIQYNSDIDYRVFEKDVHECADYILNVPVSNDSNRDIAIQALVKWMRGTPDYVFELNNTILSIAKQNDKVLYIYMAAMAKFELENKSEADKPEEVTYQSFVIFLDYCANPGNKVTITRKIQKAIDAKNTNRLRSYLK